MRHRTQSILPHCASEHQNEFARNGTDYVTAINNVYIKIYDGTHIIFLSMEFYQPLKVFLKCLSPFVQPM